jgi:hypothetical protein
MRGGMGIGNEKYIEKLNYIFDELEINIVRYLVTVILFIHIIHTNAQEMYIRWM